VRRKNSTQCKQREYNEEQRDNNIEQRGKPVTADVSN
jgi:hypothetical protein